MRRGRPTEQVVLDEEQRTALQSFAGSQSLPHGLVVRSQIVLLAAEGKHNGAVAQQVGMSRQTVGKCASALSSEGWKGCTMNIVQDAPAVSRMNGLPD